MKNKKSEAPIEFEIVDEGTNVEDEDNEVENEETDNESEEELAEIESVVNDEDIDNLIYGLQKLKETKESIAFELNEEVELVFHHEDGLGEE